MSQHQIVRPYSILAISTNYDLVKVRIKLDLDFQFFSGVGVGVFPLLYCFHGRLAQDWITPQQPCALDCAIRRNQRLNPHNPPDVELLQSFGILRRNTGDDFSFLSGLCVRW